MLGGQKPYLDKTGLGFEKGDDEQSSKDSPNQILTYIYCFKNGHSSKRYFSRRKAKQKVKKPKNTTNTKGPKKIWVPKVKITSDAGVSYINTSKGK